MFLLRGVWLDVFLLGDGEEIINGGLFLYEKLVLLCKGGNDFVFGFWGERGKCYCGYYEYFILYIEEESIL